MVMVSAVFGISTRLCADLPLSLVHHTRLLVSSCNVGVVRIMPDFKSYCPACVSSVVECRKSRRGRGAATEQEMRGTVTWSRSRFPFRLHVCSSKRQESGWMNGRVCWARKESERCLPCFLERAPTATAEVRAAVGFAAGERSEPGSCVEIT